MQIDRLRLVGFKSFADAAEVTIGPGLTGIVGPNGCGKSNLAEALRWVMGENSARRLRGGAMDDVIFGGAAGRPARNVAEVLLSLDNRARDAPFAFNDREEIEIVRRIERGVGSLWQINGREVRARDVQLMFADAATGGPSGAIVSQGRVGALIEAKPAERRFLLEEAAGTAGLHARRRETELKLAAAENNLTRLDDVAASLTTRLTALQKQARQAQRYRRLSDQIRRHEALLFHARWLAAESEAENRATELSAASATWPRQRRARGERRAHEMAEAALPRCVALNDEAVHASMIARCAPHDRFYAFIDTFFADQANWAAAPDYRAALSRLAELGGMSKNEVDSCLKDATLENQVISSRLVAANQLGVNATPTFFVNGTKFSGAPTVEEFDKLLSGLSAKS